MGRERRDDKDLMQHVGKALQAHFDQLVSLPVPPRLLNLLNELEQRDPAAATEAPAAPTLLPPVEPTRTR